MKLGNFYTVILLLTFNLCWAQYDSTYIFKDFNEDGYTDTLLKYYDGGSGYGGNYIEIRNGATDASYAMDSDACFCQIRQTFIVPENLRKTEHSAFLKAIIKELLPSYRSEPDPSLSWMLAAELNLHQVNEDSLFFQIINPQQPWIDGEMVVPANYHIEITGDLLGLYRHEHAASGYAELMNDSGYMAYYAHNHYSNQKDTFELAAKNDRYEIYKTKHGIVAKKGNTYKWIFVTDVFVTWAPEKLRWPSIGNVRLVGKYLLFEQHLPPQIDAPIHVINIETGKFGRFSNLIDAQINPLAIESNSIQFQEEVGKIEYSFDQIFKALDQN